MSLVDAASQHTPQPPSKISQIIELKDVGIGTEPEEEEEDYKRTILLEHWRRRLRAKDFVDRLLAKEEKEAEVGGNFRCASNGSQSQMKVPHQPLQMHFGAVIENGLMKDNQFCYGRQTSGSLGYASQSGASGLSASTPALSSSASFNSYPGWQWHYNNGSGIDKHSYFNYYPQN